MPESVAVRNWAMKHPPLLAGMAVAMVKGAPECLELLTLIVQGKFAFEDAPSASERLKTYKNHRRVIGKVWETICPEVIGGGNEESGKHMAGAMSWLNCLSSLDVSEMKAEVETAWNAMSQLEKEECCRTGIKLGQDIKQGMRDLSAAMLTEALDDGPSVSLTNYLKPCPEIFFFLSVTLPCWMLYGQTVTHLFRTARNGDVDSLEALLRLDKLVIHDKWIAQAMERYRRKSPELFMNLAEAYKGRPKKLKIAKLKGIIAGYISKISQAFPHPLTAIDIRELFDAVAQDQDSRVRIDTDLPEGDEAWAKAIQRERLFLEFVNIRKSKAGQILMGALSGS